MKKKKVKILIIILLVLALIFGIVGYVFTKMNNDDPTSSDTTDVGNEDFDDDWDEDEDWEDWEEEWEEDEDWDDEDWDEDEDWDDEFEEDEEIYYEELVINNDEPYTNNNFLGFNGVYLLMNFEHPTYKIKYTEEQENLELDRIAASGVKIVRSGFSSGLAYNSKTDTWDWGETAVPGSTMSPYFADFIRTAKKLQDRGIDLALSVGWNMKCFDDVTERATPLKDGYAPDALRNPGWEAPEGTPADQVLDITTAKFKTFVTTGLNALKAYGVNNVKYCLAFTECNNAFSGSDSGGRDYARVEKVFSRALTALHEGLVATGNRAQYKIVAPCDNFGNDFDEYDEDKYSRLVRYTLKNHSDIVDIIGSHNGYDRGNDFANDEFYGRTERKIGNVANEAVAAGKEFWLDEYNVVLNGMVEVEELRQVHNNVLAGVAMGAMFNSVLNAGGISNVNVWMMVDQQWTSTTTGGESDYGVQIGTGLMPNMYESSTPKSAWYAFSMMQKYIGQGKLFKVNDDLYHEDWAGIYYSAMERHDGHITVIVTNYETDEMGIELTFEKALGGKTFYRHVYDIATVKPTPDAQIIGVNGVAKNVDEGLFDVLPACSVAVYTTDPN